MTCADCVSRLHDYVDGELAPNEADAVAVHLRGCEGCRAQFDSIRALLTGAAGLPKAIAPESELWGRIELEAGRMARDAVPTVVALDATRMPARPTPRLRALRWLAPVALAASVVFLATLTERGANTSWLVAAVTGAPRVDTKAIGRETRFRLGQWLETDAGSSAKVTIGSIGEVTVDPNSRLRLVGMAATDHRLELKRGTLNALIWAPPRLFFVDTPSATAVDLGCAYTLTVDDDGHGELHVSIGYVALEHGDRESIIPSGMTCLTRRGAGPGTPFAADASAALRAALTRFDFEPGAARAALPTILSEARIEDAVTLWHLLARTRGTDLGEVFAALDKLSPAPAGVTRDGILAGDAAMRRAWGNGLGLGSF
jgi:ferric-dicitrate binding protein FerR (iron transport regulator)